MIRIIERSLDISTKILSINVEFDIFLNCLLRNVGFIGLKYYVLFVYKWKVILKILVMEYIKWEE